MVGSEPGGPGSVCLFSTSNRSLSLGKRALKSSSTNAFLTGKIPIDFNCLKPRTLTSKVIMLILIKSLKFISLGILGSKKWSTALMSKLTRICPAFGPPGYSNN
mgnify:CR=1 FL=1